MSEKKEFNTLDVLGAATGYLMREMGGIYEVLSFVAGEDVYTHQIPRISREFGEQLKRLRPDLSLAFDECKAVTAENVKEIGERWTARYGATIAVHRMSEDEHERIDPLSELTDKIHPSKIVVVSAPEKE